MMTPLQYYLLLRKCWGYKPHHAIFSVLMHFLTGQELQRRTIIVSNFLAARGM